MIKNAIVYNLANPIEATAAQIEEALHANIFNACGASQEKSTGWVPPRDQEHGALLESVGGQWILKLMVETKSVPAAVVKRRVDALAESIEATTGRKLGKKERREMADEVRQNCLPYAFAKQSATLVWIDPTNKLLVIDASSQAKCDEVVTALIKAIDGLAVQLVNTQISPASAMANILVEQQAPDGFTIDRECELKACDEIKAMVKYGRHPLDIEEVAQHIRMGKMPTKLALTYRDRVSFVLTDAMKLRKVEFLDVVFSDFHGGNTPDANHFDADVAIATGELVQMIPALLEALGGATELS